jgi:hypothetical protein
LGKLLRRQRFFLNLPKFIPLCKKCTALQFILFKSVASIKFL